LAFEVSAKQFGVFLFVFPEIAENKCSPAAIPSSKLTENRSHHNLIFYRAKTCYRAFWVLHMSTAGFLVPSSVVGDTKK